MANKMSEMALLISSIYTFMSVGRSIKYNSHVSLDLQKTVGNYINYCYRLHK